MEVVLIYRLEIDHNFSRAHRIVTTSILPIVEQYGKHSEAVWEGSKFWKQFFEASANVSLNGYQENADESLAETAETDATETEDTGLTDEMLQEDDETITQEEEAEDDMLDEEAMEELMSSPSAVHAHSTPRIISGAKARAKPPPSRPSFAGFESPYETLKDEKEGKPAAKSRRANPITPGKGHALPDMSMTPDSSPFVLPTRANASQLSAAKANKDTILHQGILNKTYRIAATPLTSRKQVGGASYIAKHTTPGTANQATRSRWMDETLSSPDEPTPQLRAEMFSSPVRPPRTPGVSVQTPGLKKKLAQAARDRETRKSPARLPAGVAEAEKHFQDEPTSNFTRTLRGKWDSDEDESDFLGESPAKTMQLQFDLPKQTILQTPGQYWSNTSRQFFRSRADID